MIIHISWPQPTGGDRCLPGKGFCQSLSDGSPALPVPRQHVGGSSSAMSEAILVPGTLMLTAFRCGTAGNQWRLLNVYTNVYILYIFICTRTSCSYKGLFCL